MIRPDQSLVTIRARFPRAQAVFILGEFNNWSTSATPMSPAGAGHWEIQLPMHDQPSRTYFFVWEKGKPFGKLVRHHSEPATPRAVPQAMAI